MICINCKIAGRLLGENEAIDSNELPAENRQQIEYWHERCMGCDCQHRVQFGLGTPEVPVVASDDVPGERVLPTARCRCPNGHDPGNVLGG